MFDTSLVNSLEWENPDHRFSPPSPQASKFCRKWLQTDDFTTIHPPLPAYNAKRKFRCQAITEGLFVSPGNLSH
jgi:hypothetical protein